VHERQPEIAAMTIGDRLLLAAPGEPSVEMGRRFEAAVRPVLPAGIKDVIVVGLANDYLGYFTTPEEYEVQHYEGGHTVFGKWTSLLARDTFVTLTRALATGAPAPAPVVPGGLGSTDKGTPDVGGAAPGALVEAPRGVVRRMSVVDVRWTGGAKGADRPLDAPFLTVERRTGTGFAAADSDLGLGVLWREADGAYHARYDVPPSLPAGTYRVRIATRGYDLRSEPFTVAPSDGLRPLGVTAERSKKRSRRPLTRLVVTAQNPPPDPARAIVFRDIAPAGGRAVLRYRGRKIVARWSRPAGGWVATVRGVIRPGAPLVLRAGALRDGFGNTNGTAATLRAGAIAPVQWPPNMPVGNGRPPGPGGQGTFPP
jgi:hypothetical protein